MLVAAGGVMGTSGEEKGHCDGDSSDLCLLRWRSQDVGWGVRYLGWVRVFI